ncbi:MAG: hypothetical protein RR585_12435 [Coprobacillus sp.]
MIMIKPHHFMDIIKLYGAGIEVFVPDEKMGHDFYRVANEIINHSDIELMLTLDADDICQPCVQCQNGICDDGLPLQLGVPKKDDYNKMLDQRIVDLSQLNFHTTYIAKELCQQLLDKDIIKHVWLEEDDELTQKRYDLFCEGAHKFLNYKLL